MPQRPYRNFFGRGKLHAPTKEVSFNQRMLELQHEIQYRKNVKQAETSSERQSESASDEQLYSLLSEDD